MFPFLDFIAAMLFPVNICSGTADPAKFRYRWRESDERSSFARDTVGQFTVALSGRFIRAKSPISITVTARQPGT